MSDKQAATYNSSKTTTLTSGFLKREVDPRLLRKACETSNNGALQMMKRLLELPNVAGLVGECCLANSLTLFPHFRLQIGLSTERGRLGLALIVRLRVSAFAGILCETLPALLVDVSKPL